jgi:hypothetical protein
MGGRPDGYPPLPPEQPNDTDFDLVNCSPVEFLAYIAGYRTGLMQATEAADRRRDEEDAAVYALAVRNVHAMAKLPPYEEHRDAVARRTFDAGQRNRLAAERWSA